MTDQPHRPLIPVGSSLSDLGDMPIEVRSTFGRALRAAQNGSYPEDSRPFGEGLPREVLKLIESHDGDTYRAAFVLEFRECVYLLHVFKKKSASGRATPKPALETIRARWSAAKEHHRNTYGSGREK
jgi:phage-related protein